MRHLHQAGFGHFGAALFLSLAMGMGLFSDRDGHMHLPSARGCPTVAAGADLAPPSYAPPVADYVVTVNGNLQWVVNGLVNPTLTLTRGNTYTFDLSAFSDAHPFVINGNANNPFAPIYAGPSSGTTISFTPTNSMPATIYYHCQVHYGSMVGAINLGAPPVCAGDLNNDLVVNSTDFGVFVGVFNTPCSGCASDMNADGVVNITDFGIFLSVFGTTCN